jgi:hypothetical protein
MLRSDITWKYFAETNRCTHLLHVMERLSATDLGSYFAHDKEAALTFIKGRHWMDSF